MNEKLKIIVKNNAFENDSSILHLIWSILALIFMTTMMIITIYYSIVDKMRLELLTPLFGFFLVGYFLFRISFWDNFGITTIRIDDEFLNIELNHRLFKKHITYRLDNISLFTLNDKNTSNFEFIRGKDEDKIKFYNLYNDKKVTLFKTINSKEANTIIQQINYQLLKYKEGK